MSDPGVLSLRRTHLKILDLMQDILLQGINDNSRGLFRLNKPGCQRRTNLSIMRKSRRCLKRIHPMKNCSLLATLCRAWSDIWNCSRRMEDRIGTLTSQGGADSPSRWGHTCLGLWFLNPSACQERLHYIFFIVISCACFAYLLWNHFVYPYIVSFVVLRKFFRYFIGMTNKARRATAFLSSYR